MLLPFRLHPTHIQMFPCSYLIRSLQGTQYPRASPPPGRDPFRRTTRPSRPPTPALPSPCLRPCLGWGLDRSRSTPAHSTYALDSHVGAQRVAITALALNPRPWRPYVGALLRCPVVQRIMCQARGIFSSSSNLQRRDANMVITDVFLFFHFFIVMCAVNTMSGKVPSPIVYLF